MNFARITKQRAGKLSASQAAPLVGGWWSGGEGERRLASEEGRQELHRVWLRYTFNSDSGAIPDEVLMSHAIGEVDEMAKCWFARELGRRIAARERGTYESPLFAWALEGASC